MDRRIPYGRPYPFVCPAMSRNFCNSWPSAPGVTKTFYMIEAIREHLADLEDLYLAEQRLLDLRAGKSRTVPLEDVMARYGLESRD